MLSPPYDAVLVVSFGGPEGPDDVLPFLENVLRGRNVPRDRMLQVAEHYQHFGGVSPINAQNRELIAALQAELEVQGPKLPIYWGNRNWHPFLTDTLRQMASDGVRRAIAFFTSAYSSYSGCRQYRENIEQARVEVGAGAPQVDKLRVFYNHPGFIDATTDRVRIAMEQIPSDQQRKTQLVFTAHSIPLAMANNCRYVAQLEESCRLVSEALGVGAWKLAFQSRSGPATQPWLEPDIGDYLREVAGQGRNRTLVVVPIGFISDHMEVLYDLDTEARQIADDLGLNLIRVPTVGTHPAFVRMIRELIEERMGQAPPQAAGQFGPSHDVCPANCCLPPARPPMVASSKLA